MAAKASSVATPRAGDRTHPIDVDAAPVVLDLDVNILGVAATAQNQRSHRGLAGGRAPLRVFDAVVYSIAQHMKQRLEKRIDNGGVGLRIFALGDQPDGLADTAGDLPHQPRKPAKDRAQRKNADTKNRVLQFGRQSIEQCMLVAQVDATAAALFIVLAFALPACPIAFLTTSNSPVSFTRASIRSMSTRNARGDTTWTER